MSDEEQKKIFSENLRYYLDKYGYTQTSASLEIKAFTGFFVSFLLEIDRVLEILIAS